MNCSSEKNSRIVRVCTKLHNYCIRMKLRRGEGKVLRFEGDTVDPMSYGIAPLNNGGNRQSSFGFLEGQPEPDRRDETFDYSTLTQDFSRRNAIVAEVEGRALRRPAANRNRNDIVIDK